MCQDEAVTRAPILELTGATVVKGDRAVLDGLTLTIRDGEHTAILGPNGAGKSILISLLTHAERPLAPPDGAPAPVRVFGRDDWDIFELRRMLGVVSASLHVHFVAGNHEGRIRADAAVVSAFLASYGILRHGEVTDEMRQPLGRGARDRRCRAPRDTVPRRALERRGAPRDAGPGPRDRRRARWSSTSRRPGSTSPPATHSWSACAPSRAPAPRSSWSRTTSRRSSRRSSAWSCSAPAASSATARRAGCWRPQRLSGVFDLPVAIERADGYHYARPHA